MPAEITHPSLNSYATPRGFDRPAGQAYTALDENRSKLRGATILVVPADEVRVNQLVERFQAAGHRLTPQRRAVLRLLATTRVHPTVEQIHAAVVAGHPGIGLATVYNTLELLEGLGEVLTLDLGEGRRRYDARRPEPHLHVVCTACGRVDDVEGVSVEQLPAAVASRTGYHVVDYRFDVRGVCPACQDRA
jgi:Fur family transcriptional regulator, peroxide stress response regulator